MRTVNRFTDEFRKKIVQEVLSGSISKSEACRKYGIRGASQIVYWIRSFSGIKNYRKPERQISLLEMKNKDRMKIQQYLKEKHELEKSLKQAELRTELLETMLDVAKEELHIDVRKKYGAKQLSDLKAKIQK